MLSVAGLRVRLQTEVDQVAIVETRETFVCAIAGVDSVVYVFLLRTSPFTFIGD